MEKKIKTIRQANKEWRKKEKQRKLKEQKEKEHEAELVEEVFKPSALALLELNKEVARQGGLAEKLYLKGDPSRELKDKERAHHLFLDWDGKNLVLVSRSIYWTEAVDRYDDIFGNTLSTPAGHVESDTQTEISGEKLEEIVKVCLRHDLRKDLWERLLSGIKPKPSRTPKKRASR